MLYRVLTPNSRCFIESSMRKLLLVLAVLPLFANAGTESGVRRFDRANEELLLSQREHLNYTARELKEVAKSQGNFPQTKRGFPMLSYGAVSSGNEQEPYSAKSPLTASGTPAPSYRTMGDAAQAGVDPLRLVSPTVPNSKVEARIPEMNFEMWYYAGGLGLFIVIGGAGVLLSMRTPGQRES